MGKNIILFALFLLLPATLAEQANYGNVVVGKVVRVIDGDTFVCDIPGFSDIVGRQISVRIANINAPELKTGTTALLAKLYTEKRLSEAKVIELRKIRRDKYFRLLAEVWLDGSANLGEELLKSGLARKYGEKAL